MNKKKVSQGLQTGENPLCVPGITCHTSSLRYYKPFKKKKWGMWSSKPTSEFLSKRTEIRISKSYLYSHVHYSIIHNN